MEKRNPRASHCTTASLLVPASQEGILSAVLDLFQYQEGALGGIVNLFHVMTRKFLGAT